jgi:hypothetical protein
MIDLLSSFLCGILLGFLISLFAMIKSLKKYDKEKVKNDFSF